jgi:predicted transcriptional regulator
MITKSQLIDSIKDLPENLTIDQVIDHLVFLEKVQKGMSDVKEGRVFSKEEAKKKLKKF